MLAYVLHSIKLFQLIKMSYFQSELYFKYMVCLNLNKNNVLKTNIASFTQIYSLLLIYLVKHFLTI